MFSIVHVIHLKRGGNDEVCELDPLVHVHFGFLAAEKEASRSFFWVALERLPRRLGTCRGSTF